MQHHDDKKRSNKFFSGKPSDSVAFSLEHAALSLIFVF